MRVPLLIGVLAALLAGAAPALAQTYPIRTTIGVSKVEVRSGPTDKFYVTGELQQGEQVTVVRQSKETGWLEIKPPKGSFTWINAKHVKQIDPYEAVVVDADPQFVAPGLVGSGVVNAKPTVEAKPGFLAGSIVYIVDRPLSVDGETWLPVQPDTREVRYIPASAVSALPATTVTAPASWAIGTKSDNSATTTIPGHPSGTVKPVTTSFSTPATAPAATPPPTTYPPRWTQYGILKATTFTSSEGQPMYALETPQGQVILYATSAKNTSLKGYLNRTVSLYGPSVYRQNDYITQPYVIATYVAVP